MLSVQPPCHSLLCTFVSPCCFQWEIFTDRFYGGFKGRNASHEHCVLCHIPLQTLTGRPCTTAQHSPRASWLHLPLKDQAYVQLLLGYLQLFMQLFLKGSWDMKVALLITPQHKIYTFITDLTSIWTNMALHHECCL